MIAPLSLTTGDKVRIVATAKAVAESDVRKAKETFESWGLEVELGKYALGRWNQFSGTDGERLSDFQQALDNPEIKAIVFARGGYGTTRILDQVDFTSFKNNPKWLCGFSDITALISLVNNFGYEALHAPMPVFYNMGLTETSKQAFHSVLFDGSVIYEEAGNDLNKPGKAHGELIGGNLSMICNSMGTPSEISTFGKILFLEDLTEYLYHVDRMMIQLDRAGKLENLSGLIVGHFSRLQDNEIPFGKTANEIILEHCGKYDYPITFDFPVGHEPENRTMICGREVELTITKESVVLKQ